jgi:hypothetical protein
MSTSNNSSVASQAILESAVLYSLPYKDTDAWETTALKLVAFYKDNGIVPLPVPADGKLLVIKTKAKANNSYPWLNFLITIGVEIFYATETRTSTTSGVVTKLKGIAFPFRGSDGYVNTPGHVSKRDTVFTAYDADVHEIATTVYAHDMQSYVMGYFASWFSKLTASKQAELFGLLCSSKCEVTGTTVSVPKTSGGFILDFATSMLSINTGDFKAVPNIMIGGVKASGKTALFLLGMVMSPASFASYSMKTMINELPNMWEEDLNYGIAGDLSDPATAIPHYCYHRLDVVAKYIGVGINVFPWAVLATPAKKVNMADVKAALDAEGIITGDKYLLKFFAGKMSANAALIGDGGEWVYTLHDAGKPSKLWNRPMQSCKFLKAEQYPNASFVKSCRVASKFGTLLPDGSVVRQSGRMMTVGLSTSGLAMGSGPCILNPNTHFHLGVMKTIGGRVSLHDYSHAAQTVLASAGARTGMFKAHYAFNFLKQEVAKKAAAISPNTIFMPGDTILEIGTMPGTKVIVKNNFNNVPVRVLGSKVSSAPVEDTDYSPSYFNVDLSVEAVSTTQFVKIRRYFTKATTVPMQYKIYDLDGVELDLPLEMILNNETIKGRSIHLDAFANTNEGECIYHPNDAKFVWHKEDGTAEDIDLLVAENTVSQWVEDTVQDVLLEMNVAQAEWDMLMEAGSLSGIKSVVQHNGYVTVREQIQLLVCNLPVEVEISTPDESIGTSAMTPEMVAGISIQSQKLAAILFEEAKPAQDAVLNLINMVTKTIPMTEANAVTLTSTQGREFIAAAVGSTDGLDDAKVLKAYNTLFPNGVYFVATNGNSTVNMFLDFNVVRTTMVWISGSADQISQEIVAFLRAIVNPPKKGYDSFFYNQVCNLMASLNGWLKKAFVSKGVLKRAARSAKCLVNLKVRTVYYTFLQPDADNLPKVAINPDCDSAMLLAKDPSGRYYKKYIQEVIVENYGAEGDVNPDDYKPNASCRFTRMKATKTGFILSFFNPYLLQNELVAAFRIPMFMGLGAKLVVTTQVGKSHMFLLPYLWSMSNEGDSDGDGVSMLNVGIRGLSTSDIEAMNDSWVGLKGYKIIYGDKPKNVYNGTEYCWPYAEFSESPKKKWMKWDNAADKAKYCQPYVTKIAKANYLESGALVQKHYVAAVGIAYGIASVLTFKLADALYNPSIPSIEIQAMKLAVVVAWRAIYEGLGLAGYSDAATKWFAVLGASKISGQYVFKDGEYLTPRDKKVTKDDVPVDAVSTLLYLGEKEEDGKGLSKFWIGKDRADGSNHYYILMYKAMSMILAAEKTRTFFGGLEKGGNITKLIYTEDQLKDCYVFGGLRRMGQGFDPAGINTLESNDAIDIDDEAILPKSLFVGIEETQAYNRLSNPYLRAMLINGTNIHNNVSLHLYEEMLAEQEDAMMNDQ